MVLDLNFDPLEKDDEVTHQEAVQQEAVQQEVVHQEEADHPEEADHQEEAFHPEEADHQEEAFHPEEAGHPEEGVHQEAIHHEEKRNLTDEQRFAAYFALVVIESKDSQVQKKDKELIANLLKTSLSTIERIWREAKHQIEEGQEVHVSSKKKGNVGRKRKNLELSRVPTVPLNKRRTIRGLARSLDVCRSTLHRRFQLGELNRHSSSLKPALTLANMVQRLQFCVDMLDEYWLTHERPPFQLMDNIVHIDEKWFDMTRKKNTYYLHPEEPNPLRSVRNKNSIGKVMFLTAVAKPRYGAGFRSTFDGKIGTWAFVKETAALKKEQKQTQRNS
jgi:hypothetical protein